MANFNFKKPKSDLDQKIIDIRRVARVTAGGKRFNFRVTVVAGDRKGNVGIGIGKGSDTAMSIDKAFRDARKHMIKIEMNENSSIFREIKVKYATSVIVVKPAPKGHGLIAGSSAKTVFELAGIKNISAKILSRSKNKINNAMAAIEALKQLKTYANPSIKK